MMKQNRTILTLGVIVAALVAGLTSCGKKEQPIPIPTDHQVRSLLIQGNDDYHKKRYAEAATSYSKALMLDSTSLVSMFNMATSLLRQGDLAKQDSLPSNPVNQATQLLAVVAQQRQYPLMASMAFYDLGNVAYARQQWGEAVELYKNALRANPDDDEARDNLRLAQLKKQQSDQNKNNQNQQNKDQQDQQNQQDQNKQNQDQDKQKDEQNKQDQQQQQQQPQDNQNGDQQNKDKQDPASQGDKKNGMSQQNAEQVLKAMQDQERATQRRINAQRAQQQRSERARTNRRW